MANIAIITARGGSKRIPKKNIKEFCGKPIIAYSIKAAAESGCFDEIMVSTDSKEIADIAIKYGALVPFMRSSRNSDDYSTTSDVLLEVINNYLNRNIEFQFGCCIYPTAPFIDGDKIKQGMAKLQKSDSDTVFPMVPFSYPPQRGYVQNGDGFVMKYPECLNMRSQDMEKIYHDSGQFYCFRIASLLRDGSLLTGKINGIIVSDMEVQDIDTIEDWKLAEVKYRFNHKMD